MPAGMELFPASDDPAWQLIRDVVDGSDYYLLIVGGHENPGTLARDKTKTEDAAWKKLQAFRAKVEKKHTCVYWKSAEDLKSKVIIGVTSAMKRHPAVGWVRRQLHVDGARPAASQHRDARSSAHSNSPAMTSPPAAVVVACRRICATPSASFTIWCAVRSRNSACGKRPPRKTYLSSAGNGLHRRPFCYKLHRISG